MAQVSFMKTITVPNTCEINCLGKPSLEVKTLEAPELIGVKPPSVSNFEPCLHVGIGDHVQIGTRLFSDKKYPEVHVLSPASGQISDIRYGPKNALDVIVIKRDKEESRLQISDQKTSLSTYQLSQVTRDSLVTSLLAGGLWTSFRQFPFRNIPDPKQIPPAIYVSIDQDEPFLPNGTVLLKDHIESFGIGVAVLNNIANGNLYIGVSQKNPRIKTALRELITHQLVGDYPANDPGVFLYHTKTSSELNNAWYITAQDVLRIAEWIVTAHYPIDQLITLGGPGVSKPMHYKTRIGMSIKDIVRDTTITPNPRYIAGGIMTGRTTTQDDFLGADEHGVNVLSEETVQEWVPYIKPGLYRPTSTTAFLSALLPIRRHPLTTALQGSPRDCISCGDCVPVCPVNLLPQFIHKHLENNQENRAIEHGLLDCVECGLCSYICPSKIELTATFKSARSRLEKTGVSS